MMIHKKFNKSGLTTPPLKAIVALAALVIVVFTISFDASSITDSSNSSSLDLSSVSPRDLLEYQIHSNKDRLSKHIPNSPHHEEVSSSEKAKFEADSAIALISFGKEAANGTLLEQCILSLRRRGEFDGKVMVITDAPRERYEGEFDENVIILKAKEEDILYDHFTAPAMKYKRFKTLLIDYMDDVPELDPIEWIYYLDIDILVGAPFITMAKALNKKYYIRQRFGTPSVYMFKDPDPDKYALNSGFIIINRRTSDLCLDAWRNAIDTHPDAGFDQASINYVIENEYSNHCKMVGLDVEDYLTYPNGDDELIHVIFEKHFSPLIHIFNSCFAQKVSPEVMEKFVADVLDLNDSERNEHKYGKSVIHPSTAKWSR
mmetsp:Transcript_3813/g.8113  ORF Transcript_3813/g.8113 Transcript_3813/m.8113 type:complete len:374 (-) Transcript_3813:103-1224(-)